VPADEFFLGVYLTAVAEGELLTSIDVPASGHGADGFDAVTIGVEGTCIVNAAASLSGGSPRIAIGCVAATPVLVEPAAADEESVRAAVRGAALDPPSDVHASADYRRHLAEVCALRAVAKASERGRS
jgi:carbon-monoxide dehydrogenase medium subunit